MKKEDWEREIMKKIIVRKSYQKGCTREILKEHNWRKAFCRTIRVFFFNKIVRKEFFQKKIIEEENKYKTKRKESC